MLKTITYKTQNLTNNQTPQKQNTIATQAATQPLKTVPAPLGRGAYGVTFGSAATEAINPTIIRAAFGDFTDEFAGIVEDLRRLNPRQKAKVSTEMTRARAENRLTQNDIDGAYALWSSIPPEHLNELDLNLLAYTAKNSSSDVLRPLGNVLETFLHPENPNMQGARAFLATLPNKAQAPFEGTPEEIRKLGREYQGLTKIQMQRVQARIAEGKAENLIKEGDYAEARNILTSVYKENYNALSELGHRLLEEATHGNPRNIITPDTYTPHHPEPTDNTSGVFGFLKQTYYRVLGL